MAAASDLWAKGRKITLRFDRAVAVEDPGGGTTSEWREQFQRSAVLIYRNDMEAKQAARTVGAVSYDLIVRFDSDSAQIENDWRAVEMLNGSALRYLAINNAVDREGKRQFITISAEQGRADA